MEKSLFVTPRSLTQMVGNTNWGMAGCKYFLTQHIKIRNTFNGGDLR